MTTSFFMLAKKWCVFFFLSHLEIRPKSTAQECTY